MAVMRSSRGGCAPVSSSPFLQHLFDFSGANLICVRIGTEGDCPQVEIENSHSSLLAVASTTLFLPRPLLAT